MIFSLFLRTIAKLFGLLNLAYTPPEYRRKGYATACVAALSQKQLDQGCRHCFLIADLANLTANHIYQAIGTNTHSPPSSKHNKAIASRLGK
ncbi:MAG: GNAT family N-acetyltransferase [Nostoc sp. DedVER02]|uniref:GNAT family N-acetyltransferase n=1 Tax=unclassified Nostoc TaxID=2593658 RepID=UPI002AD4884A|nr:MULTISPECIES: GNAT family N-acetyltransferase [unclassified Nostoc]MDZ7986247.1 GNAT family N-acetyltransferase [Nostoc sp. DedVER02]MDZ8112552.1 GNAT family N-acetyltransferase [Nostoc sp. DedVER01b]